MRYLFFIVPLLILSACVTSTPYGPMGYYGGYKDGESGNTRISRFAGNAKTDSRDALMFAKFRAIEVCYEEDKTTAFIVDVKDLSTAAQVQQSNTQVYQQPTYVYGSTYGNTYSGMARGGSATAITQTWNETYNYPTFEVYYECKTSIPVARAVLEVLSRDELKPYVKDLLGAIQIKSLNDDSPNKGVLELADLIIRVDGKRIQNQADMRKALEDAPNKQKVKADIIRDGKNLSVFLKTIDIIDMVQQSNDQVIVNACSPKSKRPVCMSKRGLASEGQ